MASRFSVVGLTAAGAAPKTAVNIIGSATVTPVVYDLLFSSPDAPNDYQYKIQVGHTTAVGTAGSNPTPAPLDGSGRAATSTAGITHSAEPTYSPAVYLLELSLNLRGSYRWSAQAYGEFRCKLAASAGIGVKVGAFSTATLLTATVHFWE